MRIQILTSKNSWLYKNKHYIKNDKNIWKKSKIITSYKKISKNYEVTAILSYYRIIPEKYLYISKHNIVVHESNLPFGRGFSPLFRQIAKGKKKIIFTLFKCSTKMDEGYYYLKKSFYFDDNLLYDEIKIKQIGYAKILIEKFISNLKKKKLTLKRQKGKPTYFRKLNKNDSKIDINKSINSQFNKMRTKDNNNFPNFFYFRKRKYILKLSRF